MQPRILTIYLDSIPDRIDGLNTESFAQWTLVYNIVDRLLEFGSNGELAGNLAKDWQRMAGNQKTWRFQLAEGRSFHDGSPVTAVDVATSLKLAMTSPDTYGSSSNSFSDNVTIESDQAITLTATQTDANVLEQLNMNAFAIRKHNTAEPVYSGCYQVSTKDQQAITLTAVTEHPNIHELSYKTIIIKKISDTASDNTDYLNGPDCVVLSRNGFLFHQQKLPASAKMFPFAAGSSHILTLRSSTPHMDWIKFSFHEVMYKKKVLAAASHARPLNSFFPPGFVVNAPVIPASASRPDHPINLKISAPLGLAGTGIQDALKQELAHYSIFITWLSGDEWKILDETDQHDERDGFIAACHLDNQDPVRLAKHYFTGPRRALWQLPQFVQNLLDKAAALPTGLERDRMIRNFYKAVVTETPCIPLFFCPMIVWSSGDVDLSHQEFYGNTIKFSKIQIGESAVQSREEMNLSLRMFAHDFKRPFSLIKTAGQLIEAAATIEDIRRISESLLPQMSRAMSSVDGMIRDLLQLEGAKEDRCLLGQAVRNAVDQALASFGKARDVNVQLPDETALVNGDPVSIERIFANLIHNALESTPDGLNIWIESTPPVKGDNGLCTLTVTVGNEGTPIKPEILNRLFDNSFSEKGKGRGLGLSIVQSLVSTCGGSIAVTSDQDAGTRFHVTLISHPNIKRSPETSRGPIQLILVEDDPFIREAWEITWQGKPIQTFSSPDELFASVNGKSPVFGPDTVLVTDYLFDNSTLTGADVVTFGRSKNVFKILLASDYIDPALSTLVDGTVGKSPIAPHELIKYLSE